MALMTIDIGGEALQKLIDLAVAERRPIHFEAEVLVLRSLGCWPYDQTPGHPDIALVGAEKEPTDAA